MAGDDGEREIEDILVDTYNEDEELSAWEVAFQDRVATPFETSVFGLPVTVRGFRADDGHIQCFAVGAGRERWIGIDALDPERLPDDLSHLIELYQGWRGGDA